MDMPRALTPEEITEQRQAMAQRAAELAVERELSFAQTAGITGIVDVVLVVNGHEIRTVSTPETVARIMALLVGLP